MFVLFIIYLYIYIACCWSNGLSVGVDQKDHGLMVLNQEVEFDLEKEVEEEDEYVVNLEEEMDFEEEKPEDVKVEVDLKEENVVI